MSKKMIVWGDSIAKGVVYDSTRNRYTVAEKSGAAIFAEENGYELVNRAKFGITIERGLNIIEKDLASEINADLAWVEFGGNDSDFIWQEISVTPDEEHLPRTTLEVFERTLRTIIEKLRASGIVVALSTLPPLITDRYFDFISRTGMSAENILHWLGDKNHIYRFHELYSTKIANLAAEYKCLLIDLRTAFLSKWNTADYICEDGIHPNRNGQLLIGETTIRALAL